MMPWQHITFLGDSVVTLPAAAAVILWLVAGRSWRMAFWWSLLFGLGMVVVVASKIAFVGWGLGSQSIDFTGISGHATRATALYPVVLYLMLQHAAGPARWAAILAGLGFGVLVGVSRVVLHDHSVSEVVMGCALGGAIALAFMSLSRPLPKPRLNRWLPALAMLALLPTKHAEPAPTTDWINAVALYVSGRDKPFVRTWGPLAKPDYDIPAHEAHQMHDSRALQSGERRAEN